MLQVPLRNGWRRETTIREYSKSGIRGEVVYVAPCGKRFKQYPDIIRVGLSPLEGQISFIPQMFYMYLPYDTVPGTGNVPL
jgi:hypothetical protein